MDEIERGELLESLELGPRPRAVAGECVMVRELGEGDLDVLRSPGLPSTAGPKGPMRIRHTHHLLAQQIAKGHSMAECALITGYAPATISVMKGDPTFRELVAFYTAEAARVFSVGLERMQALGLSSLDELQRRLEEAPDDWSKRELMELVELMMIKGRPQAGQGLGPAGGPGVSINVKFVQAEAPQGITIEQAAREGN